MKTNKHLLQTYNHLFVAIGVFILLWTSTTTAQGIEVPGANKELKTGAPISIDAVPDLSFVDHPAYWNQGYSVACRKANQCARKARRFVKKGKYIDGLGYAAKTFEYKPRKKATRRALEVLKQDNYARAIKEFDKNLQDYPEILEYQDWQSSKAMFYRMWFATRMNRVNAMIQQLDHPKVKITVNPVDHHMLGQLAGKLSTYRNYSANDYYKGGQYYLKLGQQDKDKEQYKRAAMAFRIADYYINGFKDAKSQSESAKKQAISSVYFSAYYDQRGKFGGTLDEDVKANILRNTGFRGLEFIEIVNSKSADYHVNMVINPVEYITRGKTSDKQEYSQNVTDENGNVVTKKATITTATYGYNTHAKINVEVIEKKTNKMVYSTISANTYEWIAISQKGSGDTDIVKRKHKRYLGKQPDSAPAKRTLYERAIALCANDIATKLYTNFLHKVGSTPLK